MDVCVAVAGVISTDRKKSDEELVEMARSYSIVGKDLITGVTCEKPYVWVDPTGEWEFSSDAKEVSMANAFHVVAYDFGIKHNILRRLASYGCRITVVPSTYPPEDLAKLNPDGVLFSNGPGDPSAVPYAVESVRAVVGTVPALGICMGHQLLGQALGGRTFKLKFGHHGGNHPVRHLASGRVEISAQNHNYAVDPESLPEGVQVTHINLNDGTCAGLAYPALNVISIQYHPESSPGPHDADPVFHDFVQMMIKHQRAGWDAPAASTTTTRPAALARIAIRFRVRGMSWRGLRGCWGWYQQQLSRRPVRTQVVTSTVLWGSGDVIAQQIDRHMADRHAGDAHVADAHVAARVNVGSRQADGAASPDHARDCARGPVAGGRESGAGAVAARAGEQLNYRRVVTTALFGAGFVGPLGHYWYEGLEGFVRNRLGLRPSTMRFVAAKLFLDTFAFGPVHLAAFFTYTGLVAGHSLHQIRTDLARDFLPGFLTEATVWPVIQTVNFKLVPVQHQLLFVNFFCLLDSAWLSWLKHQQDAPWKAWLANTLFGGSESNF
ncbi:unnamed protein product [Closterium sp. NIES-65]|nr:unnamed protein product [Closterium sp. NIES-65]